MRKVALCAAVALFALRAEAQPAAWAPDSPQICGDKPAMDIAECLKARTGVWTARMKSALRQASSVSNPQQRRLLAEAQGAWDRYRIATCSWDAAGEGSIAGLNAVECDRRLTEARAIELQRAITP